MALTNQELVAKARVAREKAYVPYSNFPVGAAIETEDGQIFTGCNIENATYGATVCAERVAIQNAIANGARKIKRIAVVCTNTKPCMPCGICRQVIAEFATDDLSCICAPGSDLAGSDQVRQLSLNDLLPNRFDADALDQ
ncbi:MAG: cytidine deaminase [Eubacteriales bacterium]|nr:cytidine deaminase [Eubacteriales bacterium]